MKSKIIETFGSDKLYHNENITYSQIHVADLTRFTKNVQSIEIYNIKPEGIATLLIENPNLDISATFFKPQCFLSVHGKELESCEGVFYLSNSTDETWILFIEIKDCKGVNISNYFKDAKKQIINTVKIFRDRQIITRNKRVYANVSFPRKGKANYFNQFIQIPEKKKFLDDYNIFIKGTNRLVIKNHEKIF